MSYGESPVSYGTPRRRSSGMGCLGLLILGAVFLYVVNANRGRQEVPPDRTAPPRGVSPAPPGVDLSRRALRSRKIGNRPRPRPKEIGPSRKWKSNNRPIPVAGLRS